MCILFLATEELHTVLGPLVDCSSQQHTLQGIVQGIVVSLSQHFKDKFDVNIENDAISTTHVYEERDKLQKENFQLKTCIELQKKTLNNILGLVGSAAEVLKCEKADNSHVNDPIYFLSKLILMVDHAPIGTDGGSMQDFVRFKDSFDSLLLNIQEICHKRQPKMNSASSDGTADKEAGLID